MSRKIIYLLAFSLLIFSSVESANGEKIWGEAEKASSITAPLQIIDDATASGGQYITVESGNDSSPNPPSTGIARYIIRVKEGGVYRMYLRVLCSPDVDAESSDSCWVRIEGVTLNITVVANGWIRNNNIDYTVANPQDWFWSQLRHYEAYPGDNFIEMTVNPGIYNVEIAYREDGLLIDGFLITNESDVDPATLPDDIPFVPAVISSNPQPANQQEDVYYKTNLSWTPGQLYEMVKHNLFFDTNFNDVNEATIKESLNVNIIVENLDVNSFNPGNLEFGLTYYWRIDDVNSSDSTVYKGDVWSFTVEPLAYPIPAANIISTASSQSEGQGPERTIDGSGLMNGLHSTFPADMWLSAAGEPGSAWIQYEFDKPYKLNEMRVWNYNGDSVLSLYGIKEVKIEYSADGTNWIQATISALAQAPGAAVYAANTTVPFDGSAVKYVKITANNNFIGGTGIFNKYGLSEVRFTYIPVSARYPVPENEEADVAIDTSLSWRPGREAAQHKLYLSTNQQAVIDGTAPALTISQSSFSPSSTLALGSTCYWRVDEVNNAEIPTTWTGDIWSFTTQPYITVDDFESYNDILSGQPDSKLIYETWTDGYVEPPAVRTNGSTIGYSSGASMDPNFYGGEQSVPLLYNNTTLSLSEVTVDPAKLPIGRNWSIGSPKALVLWVYGDPLNTGTNQLYVKIGNAKATYTGDIARPRWQQWTIDLAAIGANLSNVTEFAIGLERTGGTGGSGTIFLDEIRLYGVAPELPEEIWFEAESGTVTAPMLISNDPNASGGRYIAAQTGSNSTTNPPATGGVASYSITVQGGTYKIDCRVIAPSATDDAFWVRIPGATTQTVNHTSGWVQWNGIAAGADWHWDIVHSSQASDAEVEWTMAAGTYTLQIAYREDGAQLDAIVITKIR